MIKYLERVLGPMVGTQQSWGVNMFPVEPSQRPRVRADTALTSQMKDLWPREAVSPRHGHSPSKCWNRDVNPEPPHSESRG